MRHLALHLGLPEAIVWKTPSADLWAGQSDESELGYSYADLDRRELRYGVSTLGGDEPMDGAPCWRVEVSPSAKEAPYARIELWVRKDNYVPLQWRMYARSGALLKTLLAQEVRQMEARWFITRSRMTNHAQHRTTELFLDEIRTDRKASPEEFTVRNLEKL